VTFLVKQASLLVPAATGNQTVTVGFQPTAIFFWTNGWTASGDAADAGWGVGFYGANVNSSADCLEEGNNLATTSGKQWQPNPWSVTQYSGAGVAVATGTVNAVSSTGFTINWTGQVTNTIVHYLALGGTDVSAYANALTPRTTTGTQAVTGVGFTPKLVIFNYGQTGVIAGSPKGYGAAQSATNRWAFSASGASGATMAANNLASRIQDTTKCVSLLGNGGPTTLLAAADLVSMDADGFTLNWTTATATAFRVGFLCIAGSGQFATGTFTKAANTTATSETINAGFSTAPAAYMLFNHAATNSTAQSTGWRGSIGGTDGTAANAIAYEDKNAVIPTQARRLSDSGSNALNSVMHLRALPTSVSAAGADETVMNHGSFNSTGFVANYSTNAVTTQYINPWLAFGGAPITEPANPTLAGPVDDFEA